MGRVEADGEVFTLSNYEKSPGRFAALLSRAKTAPGYAKCLCNSLEPKLVIRRIRRKAGDYYLLAKWPLQGSEHDQNCRFGRFRSDQAGETGTRIPAVTETEEGFSIRPDFSLRRLAIGLRREPAEIRLELREQASQPQRAKLGLLSTMYYLWETARLNHLPERTQRAWTDVYPCLNNVLAQGSFGKFSMQDLLYLVPPFDTEAKTQINHNWNSFIEGRSRSGKIIPHFLILGEIKDVNATEHSMRTLLRHHKSPLYMDNTLADTVAIRYPSEEAAIREGNPESRVMGLFLVERSDMGYLNVQNAALMLCSRDYIPCDSDYEVRLADRMAAVGRAFMKPMFVDQSLGMIPDFVTWSGSGAVHMEVWGMDDAKYLQRKREKIASYRAKGLRLWEWQATDGKDIPAFP